ncbi:matrix-remodeling-associated protein 7 [Scaptodrosophila lebanonensis]|uniref:Matrix-remodeling-associated protein 7 n=1 Tax=Drosophila lebanonensis TaxID=7225 RepID=A0A6J2T7C4_DROLE|nr:matrix-remodeling-associated protein 7 [Scaptodrosophila lebanonensis]
MQEILYSLDGIFFGLSGYYLAALLVSALIALYFTNFFKDDEQEDEGLGADEVRLEDDPKIQAQLRARLQSEIDDDEAYEDELLSDSETEQGSGGTAAKSPYHYNHLVSKFKTKRYQRKLEKNLTPKQMEEERRIESEQLAAIFDLLRKQEAELNLNGMSEVDLKEQVKLYR